jgi:hypothetical protein
VTVALGDKGGNERARGWLIEPSAAVAGRGYVDACAARDVVRTGARRSGWCGADSRYWV